MIIKVIYQETKTARQVPATGRINMNVRVFMLEGASHRGSGRMCAHGSWY